MPDGGLFTADQLARRSVEATEYNREGIRVGTAVCTIVRKQDRSAEAQVLFRDFWGTTKRADLLESIRAEDRDSTYRLASPRRANRYSFRPEEVSHAYNAWVPVPALSGIDPLLGLNENRGGALFDLDRASLAGRLRRYLDADLSWERYREQSNALVLRRARFNPEEARERAVANNEFSDSDLMRYSVRPFDLRWCYWIGTRPIWNEPRPLFKRHVAVGNGFVVSRPAGVSSPEGVPFYFTRHLEEMDVLKGHAYHIPRRAADNRRAGGTENLFVEGATQANLSATARDYLTSLGLLDPDTDDHVAGLIWMHALAIGYAPAYLAENADGIRRDWPRIPLPATRMALEASGALGERVAALLDTETVVPGVTAGNLSPLLRTVGAIATIDGDPVNPDGDDLALTVNWGYAGQKGVTMPGRGRTELRDFDDDEQQAIAAEAAAMGQTADALTALLGGQAHDVYLNGRVYWGNVPAAVWDFYIGGYQVMKKWLSYRERDLLGRPLRVEEAREVTAMARRLTALVLLRPALDANYAAITSSTYRWPTT